MNGQMAVMSIVLSSMMNSKRGDDKGLPISANSFSAGKFRRDKSPSLN